ncbi:MAG: phosphate acyltransferase PlsX [Tissierellia bacterium]|nr:phosphate acyltransferase PlsX [Tissierellia bacterium]
MKLLFDTNGGDNAPFSIVKGAIDASNKFDVEIGLIGKEEEIKKVLEDLSYDESKVEIIPAEEKIENDEEPAFAIRKKKNSSIVIGLKALKEGKGDAFISAGSTGALLAGGLFLIGRIKGVKRAVLPTFLPGIHGETMIIDSGANMDCDGDLLMQFAQLGSAYLKVCKGIQNPKVGLLNVGQEPGKGNQLSKEAYQILENSSLNFIGNVEASHISVTKSDVVVCDGFDGNILLKSVEGTAGYILKGLFETLKNSDLPNTVQGEIKNTFSQFTKKLDASEIGGTILLGIQNLVIKAHGNSNDRAIMNAAKIAIEMVHKNIIEEIEKNLENEMKGA